MNSSLSYRLSVVKILRIALINLSRCVGKKAACLGGNPKFLLLLRHYIGEPQLLNGGLASVVCKFKLSDGQ